MIHDIDGLLIETATAAKRRLEIIELLQIALDDEEELQSVITKKDKTFLRKLFHFPGDLTHVRLNKILTIIKDHNEGE